ncbi:hypothetical protein [Pedobacter sp. Hv1]|uniref:hypothetical protein n=1 Tax=Pedobacter sp. Hv1 TaxID=1740090 RepID=UPI00128F00C2|nr:hypothetical protein [Pedobacter sp. Hv1]
MKKLTIALLTMLTILVSCKKDNSNKNPDNSSRTLRYEVTGNFTGAVIASYTTAAGSTANDPITLPWNREINYAANVTAAIILITGNGGIAGQKVTVVIKRGGNQVGAPFEIVAEASGSFSKPAPIVVF